LQRWRILSKETRIVEKALHTKLRNSKAGIESTKESNTEDSYAQICFYKGHKYGGQMGE
jgi:hypothetical protein